MRKSLHAIALCLAMTFVPNVATHAAESEETSTLVIYRPKRFTGGAVASSYRVNDQHVGKFKSGWIELKVTPGRHQVRNFFPASREAKYEAQEGKWRLHSHTVEVTIEPGGVAYVEQASDGELAEVTGTDSEAKARKPAARTPTIARIEGTFVTPGEAKAWERCQESRSLDDCDEYKRRFPLGAHVAEADEIVAGQARPLPVITKRDRVLPPEIRRDKYMISLTTALKEERYDDALTYFEELESMGIEQAPSFYFYYGEALLRTGKPDQAIDRLYQYIAEAGPEGEHYMRALELSNEAEDR